MARILTDFPSPSRVAAAIEDSMYAFVTATGGWPGIEVHDEPELLWTLSDVPDPSFNIICRARLPETGVDAAIQAAVVRCRSREVPALWLVGPSTTPTGLGDALARHGFVFEESSAGLAADLALVPERTVPLPPGLTIELVRDDAAMDVWSRVCCEASELSDDVLPAIAALGRQVGYSGPHYHYLAYFEGVPAGTLTLFLAGGVAGFYDGSTLPEARRRGIFESLMRAAIAEARGRGYRTAVLHASDMSANVAHRLGFREYCTIDQYVWEPD